MNSLFGSAIPPRIHNPDLFLTGFLIGLAVILLTTFMVDMLGTAMFKRGYAKPFYIKGHRIHHKCIYLIVPSAYVILVSLFFLGYVKILWGSLWYRCAFTALLVAATIAVDFIGDRYWPRIRKNVILHHEWIYTIVPAYILTNIVVLH